ncbi:hypothetical protein AGMMS49942_25180 [Spirochaetia bacterium]|nr:hypothetical protein AGMMS49942_25180 [Spirochaetia bacterium]
MKKFRTPLTILTLLTVAVFWTLGLAGCENANGPDTPSPNATNPGGTGPGGTGPGATDPTDTTAPAEVGALNTAAGNEQVVLTWTDPTDSDFSKVVITYTNVTAQSVNVTKGIKTKTITGLTNNTPYTFTVKTVDTSGNSSAGKTATATPLADPPITYTPTADGVLNTTTTTKIDFVFSAAVTGLDASHITIGGGLGAATKGSLTGGGTTWSLALTAVSTAGDTTVTISKDGIEGGPKSITLHKGPIVDASATSIAAKFGVDVTTNSATIVTQLFNALHDYLATNPTVSGSGTTLKLGAIALGDYIDLATLNVAGYPIDDTTIGYGKITAIDAATTPSTLPFVGYEGRLLRLIVVGINTYNGINGNGTDPHLVFQFQNVPVTRRMHPYDNVVNGYAAIEMRAYLIGNYLTGLKAAGVPADVLWAPSRILWKGWKDSSTKWTTDDTITDELFLPTEWEMFGGNTNSNAAYEKADNQGRFEYYASPGRRKKYGKSTPSYSASWWMASPSNTTFGSSCNLSPDGTSGNNMDHGTQGVAPAFCVK